MGIRDSEPDLRKRCTALRGMTTYIRKPCLKSFKLCHDRRVIGRGKALDLGDVLFAHFMLAKAHNDVSHIFKASLQIDKAKKALSAAVARNEVFL
jgi:hypothetical protein